jgi:hypothetical protein
MENYETHRVLFDLPPYALPVDVFSTVRQYDYPIKVLSDYSQVMNRYAFLLIE